MRALVFAFLLVVGLGRPVFAWDNTGHIIVAQLAYQRLSAEQRQAVATILKAHPHWQEFLIAGRPENVPEDQWAFWQASTWPDWVKQHHEQFSKPSWHYIDMPFIPPGSAERAENHQPRGENILAALPMCIDKARSATGQEKAIYLCWVIHLVGDIHQPLHCASLFNEQFPKGDHGGNDALYRLGEKRIIKLHPFWDDLLGKGDTVAKVNHGVTEAQAALERNRAEVSREEQAATTIESWAKESFAMAGAYEYENGKIIPAVADRRREPNEVPEVPQSYAETAGLIARVCVAKAGERLTSVLGQILR
jgi:hypothetical protein